MPEQQLTYEQVFDLLYQAGWRKSGDIERAATIVQAESSRIPTRENYCCVGLMAINVLVHKQYTRAEMKDPAANTKAGFALWQARPNWADWNSSRGGQILAGPLVRAHLATWNVGKAAADAPAAVGKAVTDAVPGLEGVGEGIGRATKWITTPANIGRLVLVVAGGLVIILALTKITPDTIIKGVGKAADIAL